MEESEFLSELWERLTDIPLIILFSPLLLLWLVTFVFGYLIARRKGVGIFGALVGTFPLWAAPVLLWWASRADKAVLDRLSKLEGASG